MNTKQVEELSRIIFELDPEGQRDVIQYGHVLVNAREAVIPAPTPEEWERVPWPVRWRIFFIVWYWVQIARLKKLFCK